MNPTRSRLLIAITSVLGVALVASCSSDAEWEPTAAASDSDTPDDPPSVVAVHSESVLDGIVDDVVERTDVPGVAAAVVAADDVVIERGYGVRDLATGEPVDVDTVFQIASLSKPLSSTIMAGLVGEGVIDWDDALSQHTIDLELADPWVADEVTFADLFSHRSGLPGATAGNDLEAIGHDRDTILDRLRFVPLDGFRSGYSYSNFGMTLGGQVAAAAAGTTWEELSDRLLFEPAGMGSSSMRHSDLLEQGNRAELHAQVDGEWVPDVRQPDAQAPAGGVSSTVSDLARWVRLQLAGGRLDGTQLIDPEALAMTHTPHAVSRPAADPSGFASFYGLGWNVDARHGGVELHHSGAFSNGASTIVKLVPTLDVGIVVLTNGGPIGVPEAIADSYLEYLVDGAVTTDWLSIWSERFAGLFGPPPEFPVSDPPVPARGLDDYVGTYTNDYVGEVVVEQVDGTLVALMGPEQRPFELTHVDGDLFTYLDAPELPDHRAAARFEADDDVVTAVTLSSLDGAGLGRLTRAGPGDTGGQLDQTG